MIITKIEKQKNNKNRSSVFLDEKFAFGIEDIDLFKLKLKEGLQITDDELENIKKTVVYSKAKDYAFGLAAKFSYTRCVLAKKLRDKEYDDDTINKVILFLEEYKLIDDYDYAKRYINDALKIKGLGITRIKYELRQKGIDIKIINEIMDNIECDSLEEESILPLAKKKLSSDFSYKNIMKAKRYLVSKGYSYELIDKTINSIINGEGE